MKKQNIVLLAALAVMGLNVVAFSNESSTAASVLGPGNYRIVGNASDPIIIPFKMHNGKPLMSCKINGKSAALMIDNGILWDQVWLFGSPLVKALQLKPVEEGEIRGAGEGDPTRAYTSTDLTIEFADVAFYEQPVYVSPPAAGFARMFPGTDGQLCNTFFKHFIVEFDFINDNILLHNPEQFQHSEEGVALDMKLNTSGTYSIPFAFTMLDGKVYDDRVDIDFGGVYPLKIALNNSYKIKAPVGASKTRSFGAQGMSSEYSAKIKSMTFGGYTFENPTAIFGDEGTSRIHPENLGVVGLPLFMKFRIIFDYINNKLYIEPNEDIDTPFSQ
jgi:hypothetical protein